MKIIVQTGPILVAELADGEKASLPRSALGSATNKPGGVAVASGKPCTQCGGPVDRSGSGSWQRKLCHKCNPKGKSHATTKAPAQPSTTAATPPQALRPPSAPATAESEGQKRLRLLRELDPGPR